MRYYIKILEILVMLEEYKNELIAGAMGIAATAATWAVSRRKTNAEAENTLTDGVAKIVETSNKLLDMTTKALQEEKQHHFNCTKRVEALEQKVEELTNRFEKRI